jgi:hypothetical protein
MAERAAVANGRQGPVGMYRVCPRTFQDARDENGLPHLSCFGPGS